MARCELQRQRRKRFVRTHLTLMVGTPAVERKVLKTDITDRSDPISAMPPLGLLLEPREVRDLVEYLSALR